MKLGYDFYQQDAVTTAEKLVGKYVVRKIFEQKIICRIVETEAYVGPEDKGCHAYQNKKTKRTEVMFKKGGAAYIYLIYGIHNCFNIVVNRKNKPEAVLIRAVEPIEGLEIIRKNRPIKSNKIEELTNGPGKLCQALVIDRKLNGYDLVDGDRLYITEQVEGQQFQIASGTRINIDYAEEYKDKLWRFYIKGNSFISE
ncbi:MAG: DNA-3-methyladenine glycosylase [Halothermotrichaceae bacterium]